VLKKIPTINQSKENIKQNKENKQPFYKHYSNNKRTKQKERNNNIKGPAKQQRLWAILPTKPPQ